MEYYQPPPPPPQREREVPFGVVLIIIGLIMLAVVALALLLSPVPLPLSEQLRLAVVAVAPGAADYFPSQTAVSPANDGAVAANPPPILLPETPLNGLPSEASVAEASTLAPEPRPGQPVRLQIPRIGVDAPVSAIGLEAVTVDGNEFYQWGVPRRYAAGWHNDSARLGAPDNLVLNGHHNVYGEVFRDLVDLAEGDELILYDAAERPYTYQVTHHELLLERGQPLATRLENARWIAPTNDERVTLVTCWPYTDNSHRYIVVAQPADVIK